MHTVTNRKVVQYTVKVTKSNPEKDGFQANNLTYFVNNTF